MTLVEVLTYFNSEVVEVWEKPRVVIQIKVPPGECGGLGGWVGACGDGARGAPQALRESNTIKAPRGVRGVWGVGGGLWGRCARCAAGRKRKGEKCINIIGISLPHNRDFPIAKVNTF